jgi:hypothetical protein
MLPRKLLLSSSLYCHILLYHSIIANHLIVSDGQTYLSTVILQNDKVLSDSMEGKKMRLKTIATVSYAPARHSHSANCEDISPRGTDPLSGARNPRVTRPTKSCLWWGEDSKPH